MERKKDTISPLQQSLLEKLIFPERFDHICEEVQTTAAIVLDELRGFIDKRWVQVMRWDDEKISFIPTLHYDVDRIEELGFMLTAKGLTIMENGKKS